VTVSAGPDLPQANNLKPGGYVIIPVGGLEQKYQRRSSRYDWFDAAEMSKLDEKEHVSMVCVVSTVCVVCMV